MRTLYPFQETAVKYALEHHYHINACEMGLGKSCMALEAAKRSGEKVAVFAPPFLRSSWEQEGKSMGVSFEFFPYSRVHNVKPEQLKGVGFWIADECFVAGTMVDTPMGSVPIEEIKPGQKVFSAAGVDEVVAVSSSYAEETVKINGIECTWNHPFLTEKGWVKAIDLNVGDKLANTNEAMRLLRGKLFTLQGKQRAFLREVLLREMEGYATAHDGKNSLQGSLEKSRLGKPWKEKTFSFSMAPGKQLHEEPGNKGETFSDVEKDGPQTPHSRREREGTYSSRAEDERTPRGRLGFKLCSQVKNWNQNRSKSPLQNRHSPPRIEDSHRGGWGFSRAFKQAGTRLKEATGFGGKRVESFEIQKQGSRRTYNLQVKKHPSFSVNGLLVHNCHYMKSPTARRTQCFYELLNVARPKYFMALTGTPIKNRIPDFWTLLAFCNLNSLNTSGKKLEGDLKKYRAFSRYFCHTSEMAIAGRRIEKFTGVKEEKIPELKELMKDKFIRYRVADVLADLPTMTRKEVLVNLEQVMGLEAAFVEYMMGGKGDIEAKVRSATLKAESTAEYCNLLTEGGSGPIVIFSDHVEPVKIIAGKVPGCAAITGAMQVEERMKIVAEFQAGKRTAIAATIGSLSVGVTLTAASHVIFNDVSWVPSDNLQAEKRIHRIGQKFACFAHYIDATPTDAYIRKTLFSKSQAIDKVIEA